MRRIFRPNSFFHTESPHLLHNFGTQFPLGGGLFSIFTKNRPKKLQKRAILHTSQANGGDSSPPRPPWLRYCIYLIHLSSICYLLLAHNPLLLFSTSCFNHYHVLHQCHVHSMFVMFCYHFVLCLPLDFVPSILPIIVFFVVFFHNRF